MNSFKMKIAAIIILLAGAAGVASGANVFVPTMDLTTRINLEAQLETRGEFQLSFDGGYKYQAKLLLQYYDTTLEDDTQSALIFDGAQASIKDIFEIIDFTYFTGYYGVLGEGRFYKGHLYHPTQGFDYNGYLPITGTGFIVGNSEKELFEGQLYVYQQYGMNYINTCDFNLGLNLDPFIAKLFLGLATGAFRIGTQLMYLGDETEIYLTVGNPFMPSDKKVDFDDFYLLLEEWFKMGNWNLILSVFTRPYVHYNYVSRSYLPTNQVNDLDFNFNLNYAPEDSIFAGGGELNIQTTSQEPLGIYLSPYISVFTSGVTWKVKVDFNLISQARDFITAYLNINASF
jgi:hypothetical protein